MRHTIAVLLCLLFIGSLHAQDVKRPETYNYTRAMEALDNEDVEEALDYLNKEIKENPKNGYAFAYIASIRCYKEEYGRALTAANLGVKHMPQKDKIFKAFAHDVRAEVYLQLEETDKAIEDYNKAIDYSPDDENLHQSRAQLYYSEKMYDLAAKDYEKMIELDAGNVIGYMGLGRNANTQEKYDEAIAHFDYVVKLYTDYSQGYAYRAESYIGLKKYNEAVDDIIKAVDIDYDGHAYNLMEELIEPAFMPLVSKLKIQSAKHTSSAYWPYCLGMIYQKKEQYNKAIEYYNICLEREVEAFFPFNISSCYESLGNYPAALQQIDYAIELDSTDYQYFVNKANILYYLGRPQEAITEMGKYIEHYPNYYGTYYRRGFYKDNTKDVDGAIEDYSMAIALNPTYWYAYLGRADMYYLKENKDLSMADYQKVIELDTIPQNSSCAQFAYLQLGQKEKAIEFMDSVIAQDSKNSGNYYDAACLYSRMGDKQKALEALQTAFEKGYHEFNHIQIDDDMDDIRNMPQFVEMIETYSAKYKAKIEGAEEDQQQYQDRIVEIPFSKEGDMLKVNCMINNLPLHFILDTGASTVSISNVEANFMFKNNYLTTRDVQGKQNFMTADGNISEGTIINLRNVEFGGLELPNIKASIKTNQRAPLLLGQSVLSKLGKIEIDNEKNLLKITYRQKMDY